MSESQVASEFRRASADDFRNDAGSASSTGRSTRLPSISALLNSSTADLAAFGESRDALHTSIDADPPPNRPCSLRHRSPVSPFASPRRAEKNRPPASKSRRVIVVRSTSSTSAALSSISERVCYIKRAKFVRPTAHAAVQPERRGAPAVRVRGSESVSPVAALGRFAVVPFFASIVNVSGVPERQRPAPTTVRTRRQRRPPAKRLHPVRLVPLRRPLAEPASGVRLEF